MMFNEVMFNEVIANEPIESTANFDQQFLEPPPLKQQVLKPHVLKTTLVPTTDPQLTNKVYVDTSIANNNWKDGDEYDRREIRSQISQNFVLLDQYIQ